MPAKFEVKKSRNHKFYFNLLSANGEIVLTSQMYANRPSCIKGIKSVQSNARSKDRYQEKKAKTGREMFVLKAGNNRVIGTSQLYKNKSALNSGVKAVMKNGVAKKIENKY